MVNTEKTHEILYLNKFDIQSICGNSSEIFVNAVENCLRLHTEKNYVQPLKPYLKWYGDEGHIADRIIAMPAYLGGEQETAGLKWVGSKHSNPKLHGVERASALIILNDTETHYPIAVMEGSLISGMRTAAVTTVAAKRLAITNFANVTLIGCGPIAQMQIKTLLENFDSINAIHLFDLNEKSMDSFIEVFKKDYPMINFSKNNTAEDAVRSGEVVITCTVTKDPYIEFNWLKKGAFVSNISIMDLHKEVFIKADKVIVDDWEQSNREKKIINQLVLEGLFSREQLHGELGEILTGAVAGRETDEEIIILNPMGMAIEDISCAREIYNKALDLKLGKTLDFA